MSLNNVVNNLIRAAASIPADISDNDLDRHVANLLAAEAKAKEKSWSELGLGAFLERGGRDSPDPNQPKPNKRFLASVIRNVDGHNTALLRQQAQAAREIRGGRGESSRASGGNRLFGGALRGLRGDERDRRNERNERNDSDRRRGEDHRDERRRYREEDELRISRSRRDEDEDERRRRRSGRNNREDREDREDDRDSYRRSEGSSRRRLRVEESDEEDYRRDRRRHRSRSRDRARHDSTRESGDEYNRRHERRDAERSRRRDGSDGERRRIKARHDDDQEEDRNDRDSETHSKHKARQHNNDLRPPPPPPPPPESPPPLPDTYDIPPEPISKMDKYFKRDYDPRLDYGEIPRDGPMVEVGWDNMLAILKERGQKRRHQSPTLSDDGFAVPKRAIKALREPSPDIDLKKLEKAERRKRKEERRKRRGGGGDSEESESERIKRKEKRKPAATTTTGVVEGTSLFDIPYVKKGGVREWDVGK